MSAFASVSASFSGYEIVFSGPSGQSTLTSLNLIFDGGASLVGFSGDGSASVNIDVTVTGPHGSTGDSGALTTNFPYLETIGSGLLSGWPGFPFTSVTTPSLTVDAGDVVSVSLGLHSQAACSAILVAGLSDCDASPSVPVFSFATAGPVFNLPAGWTANALDGSIANNRFVPEPSTGLLVLLGALGLAMGRRRAVGRA